MNITGYADFRQGTFSPHPIIFPNAEAFLQNGANTEKRRAIKLRKAPESPGLLAQPKHPSFPQQRAFGNDGCLEHTLWCGDLNRVFPDLADCFDQFGSGFGVKSLIKRMGLRVRNWPFWPAVDSLPGIYSYKSPCIPAWWWFGADQRILYSSVWTFL